MPIGDVPELLENILNNLKGERELRFLYSCALVNRLWSKISIPILWRNPFSSSFNSSFINSYFSSLNEHDKFILNTCGIVIDVPNTLFHYARFLKVLDLSSMGFPIDAWIEELNMNLQKDIKAVRYDVANLLLKFFIEGGATLSEFFLHMSDDDDDEYFDINPEIFFSLGQNVGFFSQLKRLSVSINIYPCPQNVIILLKILGGNAKKINTLILTEEEEYDDQEQLIHTLTFVIKSQEQLGRLELSNSNGYIISALKSQQISLREIIMDDCDFSYPEFNKLENLKNLEVIRIYDSSYTDILLNILDNNLHKINTLEVRADLINASNILQMVQKSGSLLQRLSLQHDIYSSQLLLDTLISSCPNITYLGFSRIKLSAQFLNLIGCLQNLQFLSLYWIVDGSEEEMKTSIMKFAKILPSSLHYLDLYDSSNIYADVFLDHCNAPLKKLLLKIDYKDKKAMDTLIRFCIRKKTLDNVYIHDLFNDAKLNELKNVLKDYVKLIPYYHQIVIDC